MRSAQRLENTAGAVTSPGAEKGEELGDRCRQQRLDRLPQLAECISCPAAELGPRCGGGHHRGFDALRVQGLDSERAAQEVEALLRRFEIVPMAGDAIAVAAACNFRSLRRRGITVRKTIDLLIGTWCIENRMPLLHNDGDFRPMARYLGLVEVPTII